MTTTTDIINSRFKVVLWLLISINKQNTNKFLTKINNHKELLRRLLSQREMIKEKFSSSIMKTNNQKAVAYLSLTILLKAATSTM